jgi:hypothetical protein
VVVVDVRDENRVDTFLRQTRRTPDAHEVSDHPAEDGVREERCPVEL